MSEKNYKVQIFIQKNLNINFLLLCVIQKTIMLKIIKF
jgi:hypothetical protein